MHALGASAWVTQMLDPLFPLGGLSSATLIPLSLSL